MSLARASTPGLVGLAVVALIAYGIAERSVRPVHAENYRKKIEAVRLMQRAEQAIATAKGERGIAIDARNDPGRSGVIGPQFTLITTDRGSQSAKALAAHPNFAAAITQMLLQARVGPGDLVAVGMTGSLPGLNLAVLAACRALGAEPIVITSLGASMFGATDPELTWLDMERVVADKGVWASRSVIASSETKMSLAPTPQFAPMATGGAARPSKTCDRSPGSNPIIVRPAVSNEQVAV